MSEFIEFIREKGIVGLAVAFIIGNAVTKLIGSLVDDIFNPIIGLGLGRAKALTEMQIHVGQVNILLGDFISKVIDFVLILLIVFILIKKSGVEKIDRNENNAK